jgi:hypothetical protein
VPEVRDPLSPGRLDALPRPVGVGDLEVPVPGGEDEHEIVGVALLDGDGEDQRLAAVAVGARSGVGCAPPAKPGVVQLGGPGPIVAASEPSG